MNETGLIIIVKLRIENREICTFSFSQKPYFGIMIMKMMKMKNKEFNR